MASAPQTFGRVTRSLWLVSLLAAASASAFDAELLAAPTSLGPYLVAPGRPLDDRRLGVRLVSGWAFRPVVASPTDPRVEHLFLGSLGASWSPSRALGLELVAPLHIAPAGPGNPLFDGARLGDATIRARWEVVSADRFALSLSPWVRAPLWPGEDAVGGALGTGAAGGVHFVPHPDWRVDASVGGAVAGGSRSQLHASVGARFSPHPLWSVPMAVAGRWYVAPRPEVGNPAPVEARVLPTLHLFDFDLSAVLGAGLTAGVGAPLTRVGVAVTWRPGRHRPAARSRTATPPSTSRAAATTPAPSSDLHVRVRSAAGDAVQAEVALGDVACPRLSGAFRCAAGDGVVTADAPGFYPALYPVHAETREVELVLYPAEDRFSVRSAHVHLSLAVFFDTDSAVLTAGGRQNLERVAVLLAEERRTWTIVLRGHADHRGSDEHNDALSRRRAEAVRAFLTEGGARGQIHVVALGERRAPPVHDEGELQRQRRVELDVQSTEHEVVSDR
jgi:outer membrane protein OmpA-like peptidoglycan-associated protein